MRRLLAVAITGFVIACGGGGATNDQNDDSFPPPQDAAYPVEQAIAAAKAGFGDREAARAVILAMDRGYSYQQVVAAAVQKRLAASGQITTAIGTPEPPSRQPAHLYSMLGAPGDLLATARSADGARPGYSAVADLVDQLLDRMGQLPVSRYTGPSRSVPRIDDAHFALSEVSYRLLMTGYTLAQIESNIRRLESSQSESVSVRLVPVARGDIIMVDSDNRAICPASQLRWQCTPDGLTDALNILYGPGAALPPLIRPTTAPGPAQSDTGALTTGWDVFTSPLSSGSVAWIIPVGSNGLRVTFTVGGATPNHTYVAGAHFFPENAAQCPFVLDFGEGTYIHGDCGVTREGISSSLEGSDFGTLTTDAGGNGTAEFNLGPKRGRYRVQFTVRIGTGCPPANCAVVYRTGGKYGTTFTVITIP